MELSLVKQKSPPIARLGSFSEGSSVFVYLKETDKDYDSRNKILGISGGETKKFEVLPFIENEQRTAVYISGISGSGKSTSAAKYIDELRDLEDFKHYRVYFITNNSTEDKAFENMDGFYKLDINDLYECNVHPSEFRESIVLFDDWTSIADKKIKEFVESLLKQLLENTRKNKTQIIVVNHMTQDYSKTRSIISECESYFLYPQFNMNSVLKFLRSYLDLDNAQLEMIKKLDTRVLFIRKSAPRYIISEKKIILL
jgi:hypothetical protein